MSHRFHIEMEEPPMDWDEMTCVVFATSWRRVRQCLRWCKRNGLRVEVTRYR